MWINLNLASVLLESARIARGAVKPLTELTSDDADAVLFPGGFGAAKNLSDFGFKVARQLPLTLVGSDHRDI